MPAEAILFLPGMMCDARLWQHQADSLDLPAVHADTSRADNFCAMAGQVLSLPMHPYLSEDTQDVIINTFRIAVRGTS